MTRQTVTADTEAHASEPAQHLGQDGRGGHWGPILASDEVGFVFLWNCWSLESVNAEWQVLQLDAPK